jgi:hypothetical protein
MIEQKTDRGVPINNIFFVKDFVLKLMSLVPVSVIEYWDVNVVDYDKVTGGIRYEYDKIDAVYIEVSTKFAKLEFPAMAPIPNLLKFDFIGDKFMFDSIYSQYDPIDNKIIRPTEFRYDKNLNVIAEYYVDENREQYINSNGVLSIRSCIQYKNREKLKEYEYSEVQFPLNVLENDMVVYDENQNRDGYFIGRVRVVNNDSTFYYHIK